MPSAVFADLGRPAGPGVRPASHTSLGPQRGGGADDRADVERALHVVEHQRRGAPRCAVATRGGGASCPVPSSCFTRAHLEQAVARAATRAASTAHPASLEPALERVGAEVLVHDEHGGARREPGAPSHVVQQVVQRGLADADRRVGPEEVDGQVRRARRPARRRRTLASPRASALARHRSRARRLTSTAHTVAAGRTRRQACRRSGRSRSRGRRRCPAAGGAGASSSRYFVAGVDARRRRTRRGRSAAWKERSGRSRRTVRRSGRRGGLRVEVVARGVLPSRSNLPPSGRPIALTAMAAPYEIRLIGDPVLRQRATEVTDVDGKLVQLAEDMLTTMYEAPGLGLAAPQVGVQKRLFVYDIGEGPQVVINPEIAGVPRRVGLRRGLPVDPGPVLRAHPPEGGPPRGLRPRGQRAVDRGRRAPGPVLPARARPPRRRALHRAPRTTTTARRP